MGFEYEKCSKSEKTELAKRIVTMIKECNGRFLKKDRKLGWQEVTDSQAREKVSHFFRHLRATLGTATAEEPPNTRRTRWTRRCRLQLRPRRPRRYRRCKL